MHGAARAKMSTGHPLAATDKAEKRTADVGTLPHTHRLVVDAAERGVHRRPGRHRCRPALYDDICHVSACLTPAARVQTLSLPNMRPPVTSLHSALTHMTRLTALDLSRNAIDALDVTPVSGTMSTHTPHRAWRRSAALTRSTSTATGSPTSRQERHGAWTNALIAYRRCASCRPTSDSVS